MPHIVGFNISPVVPDRFVGAGPRFRERSARQDWRNPLADLLEKVTCDFWGLPKDSVTCSFPHDPSTPTDPYPVATLIVELLFEKPDRTLKKREEYARRLAEACKSFLDELRGTTDAKVEVAVKRFDPAKDGFYTTP